MRKIVVEGKHKLTGTIKVSGAKNSVVAMIPAAILCDEESTIFNVPTISDVNALTEIVEFLGGEIQKQDDIIKIDSSRIENKKIGEGLSTKLRASYYFMGALLGRFGHAEIFFPGGCNIGARPIDFHIKGFQKMGAKCKIDGNRYIFDAKELRGAKIYLDFPSVGATINFILAAVKAKGTTIISNPAKEPEIVNIATFLNNMGAKIKGAGTNEIKIEGVERLHKAFIEIIPDRIEAGTYVIIASLIGKNLTIDGVIIKHIESLLSKLREIGVEIENSDNSVTITAPNKLMPTKLKTQVFPGFATDLGQPMSVVLTQCEGTSFFKETIYENRDGHVKYLNEMGANIAVNNQEFVIIGKTPLKGQSVRATDLRGGAAMIVAGLIAKGITEITDIEHVLRGYDNIVEKLKNVGAKIDIEEI